MKILGTHAFVDIAENKTYAKSIRTKRTMSGWGSGAAVSFYKENALLFFILF